MDPGIGTGISSERDFGSLNEDALEGLAARAAVGSEGEPASRRIVSGPATVGELAEEDGFVPL